MANTNTTQTRQQETRPETSPQSATPTDKERSIQTQREGNTATGVARRNQSSGVQAPGTDIASSPFLLMRRMAQDMDRLFENFGFGPLGLGTGLGLGSRFDSGLWDDRWPALSRQTWSPQIETFRRGDKLVVRADLPGLKKDDVKVEIEDGMLTISGERSEEHEENRDDFYRSERSYGRFYRALPLPDGASEDQCEATFRDGVLEVTLNAPRQAERKAKQIQIR